MGNRKPGQVGEPIAGVEVPDRCWDSEAFKEYQYGANVASAKNAKDWASGYIADDIPGIFGLCHEPMTEYGCQQALLAYYTQINVSHNCSTPGTEPGKTPGTEPGIEPVRQDSKSKTDRLLMAVAGGIAVGLAFWVLGNK